MSDDHAAPDAKPTEPPAAQSAAPPEAKTAAAPEEETAAKPDERPSAKRPGLLRRMFVGPQAARRLIAIACVMCLAALALIVWSLFQPTPLPVMVAMSAGQGLGTLSLLLFLWVVVADLRRAHVLDEKQDE